eukprot:COSAG05_NODE_17831_length_318_cov_1.173516_1_plen_46_part_01
MAPASESDEDAELASEVEQQQEPLLSDELTGSSTSSSSDGSACWLA